MDDVWGSASSAHNNYVFDHHDYDDNDDHHHGRTNYDYDAVFMYWKCRMVVL